MRIYLGLMVLALATGVAGCTQKGLRDLRPPSNGPDEFLVLPSKPLTMPTELRALPAPTPGVRNITDVNPKGDAIAALGGRPEMLDQTGIPAADGALVANASRYGVPSNTRAELAESDAKFRKRAARSGRIRLFPVDRYAQAYRKDSINPFDETQRWRASGRETPSSPPSSRR